VSTNPRGRPTSQHPESVIPKRWGADDIPDQTGRLAVVTGANGGLGLVITRQLARAGAHVVLACRSQAKGRTAAAEVHDEVPGAGLDVRVLDLAVLGSVRRFAAALAGDYGRIDLVINNAGVMAPPRGTTADGFELQLGINHLGHFALVGLLLPSLLAAPDPRVVSVSSTLHAWGRIRFDDLNREHGYQRYLAYGQSKLANLLFAFELDRRARAARTGLVSVAAHPGYAATNLQTAGIRSGLARSIMAATNRVLAAAPLMGALPILCAATLPGLTGGAFLGPARLGGYRGHPGMATAGRRAHDDETARRLWGVSEEATGVHFGLNER
jgi:NAD(P)-dependent dehydrogenase (short-subunit alcohol dehydrogenase family)